MNVIPSVVCHEAFLAICVESAFDGGNSDSIVNGKFGTSVESPALNRSTCDTSFGNADASCGRPTCSRRTPHAARPTASGGPSSECPAATGFGQHYQRRSLPHRARPATRAPGASEPNPATYGQPRPTAGSGRSTFQRRRARQQFIPQDAQQINIGARVDILPDALGLFRTHVLESSNDGANIGETPQMRVAGWPGTRSRKGPTGRATATLSVSQYCVIGTPSTSSITK